MLHLQSPLYLSLKVPRKEASLQDPLTQPLHRGRCSISRAFFTYLSKSPENKPPSRFPLQSPYIEKGAPSPEPSLYISQSPQKRTLPPPPLQVPFTKPLHKEKLFHIQSPLCIPFKAPRKETPSGFPLRSPYIEKDVPSPEPSLHSHSKFPEKKAPSRFPSESPIETDAPCPEPSCIYLSKSPVKEPPVQVPYQGPYGERCSSPEPSIHISQSPPVKEPPSKFPIGALQREMSITRAFYMYNLESPVKEPPSRFPSQSPHREGRSISKAHLYSSLKSLGKGSPTWFPSGAPMERDAHS
jgi:hypothetical protein